MTHYLNKQRSKAIFLLILNLFIFLLECNPISSSSYIIYRTPKVEAGWVTLIKSNITDIDTSIKLNSTFQVKYNWLAIPNGGSYILSIGYKAMSIILVDKPSTTGLYYAVLIQNKTNTGFECNLCLEDQNTLNFIKVSYIAIQSTVQYVYEYNIDCYPNQYLNSTNYFTYPYSNLLLPLLPIGQQYHKIISVFIFQSLAYNGNTSLNYANFLVLMLTNNSTSYTFKINGQNLFIYRVSINRLLINPHIINNYNRQIVFIYNDFQSIITSTAIYGTVLQYDSFNLYANNIFFGLKAFQSNNHKLKYQFWIPTNTDINLVQSLQTTNLQCDLLIFYERKCYPPFYFDNLAGICILCSKNCLQCISLTNCTKCQINFTLTAFLNCQCMKTLVSGICYDFNQSSMKDCIFAAIDSNSSEIQCKKCSPVLQLNLTQNNSCICRKGFQLNLNNSLCQQKCGDGLIIYHQCDDGNILNNDGCSSKCKIQQNFQCNNLFQPTLCKCTIILNLKLISIIKNNNNSGLFTFGFKQQNLPFLLKYSQFVNQKVNLFTFTFFQQKQNETIFYELSPKILSIRNNKLQFLVNYNFTLQEIQAQLNLNLSKTKFIGQNTKIKFKIIGDNQPLLYNEYLSQFQHAQMGFSAVSLIFFILLLISLIAPKYIGIQAILTLQLIYYSQLLIMDPINVPIGFKTFSFFKYSTGFNDIFSFTSTLPVSKINTKYVWMTLKKNILENYNVSFLILIISFILFVITNLIVYINEKEDIQEKEQKKQKKQMQARMQKFKLSINVNKIFYLILNQVSIWSILQIMNAFACQIFISSNQIIVEEKQIIPNKFIRLQIFLATFIVILNGLNLIKNIYLNQNILIKMIQRNSQHLYKQINFIYLVIMGIIILFLNDLQSNFPFISLITLIIHSIYMLIIYLIDPYKNSLKIHSYGLYLNLFIYLTFIIYINLINLLPRMSNIYHMTFVYLILIFCGFMMTFTIIRLYFEYRYGQSLQRKVQKQRQEEIKRKQLQKNKKIKKLSKNLQIKAKSKIRQVQKIKLQNIFLYENQLREEKMFDEFQWIKNRLLWTPQQKQTYYFNKFHSKPKHKFEFDKNQQFQQEQKYRKNNLKRKQKLNNKLSNSQYIQLVNYLKADFKKKSKSKLKSKNKFNL